MSPKSRENQNIQVFVRVRPSNASEVNSRSIVEVTSDSGITVRDSKQNNSFKTFNFNNVFGPQSAQIDVYRSVVQPLIDEVLSGYNCTVFAYGQTGTGKTFTMEGERSPDAGVSWENDPLAGIVPRTLSQLFDELRLLQVDFSVKVSFLELYNEELIDLLSPPEDTSKLRIFEDSTKKGAVIISGLEEAAVTSKSDVYHILEKGSLKRQTAATLMNAHSSRSHTVFTVTVHIRESANEGEEFMRTGKMNLVDLAGSENIGRSGAVDKRAREAGNINQSLLTLGRVITALVEHSPHIPYRESKLTRILKESLGGRTKTSIIATISPAACNFEETLSTLDYAHRAKNIQNKPEINQRVCKKALLKEYSEEIERLQRDLEATRQRTGVYLDQEEYSGMMLRLEQLETEGKNKEQQVVALIEEWEKRQAVCDELASQVKDVEATLTERTAIKDKQENKLSDLKYEKVQVVSEITEKDHLMLCHVETQEQLTAQADVLLRTAVHSTKDLELLHDKIDRTRVASQRNESCIQQFEDQNVKIIDQTKALIEDKIQYMSEAVSTLASSTAENLRGNKGHLNNAIATAEVFQGIPEKATSLLNSISSMEHFESQLQAGIDESKTQFLQSFSDCKRKHFSQIHEGLVRGGGVLSKLGDAMDDLKSGFDEEWETLMKLAENSSHERPLELDKIARVFSDKVASVVTIADHTVNSKNTYHQKYLEVQEKCMEKYDEILKLLSDIDLMCNHCEDITDSHVNTVSHNVSTAIVGLQEARAYMRDSLEDQKLKINCLQTQFEEGIDKIPACLSSAIGQIDFNSQLLPPECISQQGQTMRDTWEVLKSNVEDLVKEDAVSHENLKTSCHLIAEEILNDIVGAEEAVQSHISHHVSSMEILKDDVQKATEDLKDTSESLRSPLLKNIEDYKNAVEHLHSFGAKAATPTGKTPQRSEPSIPRDLAITSPHERILSRFRSKYRIMSRINPGDSIDSAYSDVDSDVSLSDIESLANKENTSLLEKERSEKSFNSSIPKMRKPLSQNN